MTKEEVLQVITDNITDNNSGAITAEVMRDTLNTMVEYTPEGSSAIPVFEGILEDSITITDTTVLDDTGGVVIYSSYHKKFVLSLDRAYYSSWGNVVAYMDSTTGLPITNRLFEYNKQQYIFDGTSLVLLSSGYTNINEILFGASQEMYVNIPAWDVTESAYFNLGISSPATFSYNTSPTVSTTITDLTAMRIDIPANVEFYIRGEGKTGAARQRMFMIVAKDNTVLADSFDFYPECTRDNIYGPYKYNVNSRVLMQVLSPYIEGTDGAFEKQSISADGLIAKVEELETQIGENQLTGKKFVVIGDSLSTSGIWQERVAELTGMTYSQEDNINTLHPLSVGGTSMYGRKKDMGLVRVRNIKELDYIPDVIFLENVNDKSAFYVTGGTPLPVCGDIDDPAYIVENVIDNGTLASDWQNNASSILSAVSVADRQFGTMLMLSTIGQGKNIAISTLPTSDGTFTITMNHGGLSHEYAITVTAGESAQSILNKILEYDYQNISDTLGDNGTSVDFYEETGVSLRITYSQGNTGIVLSITDTTTAKTKNGVFFNGESLEEWTDATKWIETVTLYSAWKGIIEYCQREFPTSLICILGLVSRSGVTPSDYLRPNGTYDQVGYKLTQERQESLLKALKEIADMYSVKYIDVAHNDNISVVNLAEYYPVPNAHPYEAGYIRWGEVIATKI